MDFLDLLFIVLYFGIILWIARWASTEKKGSTFSSVDYFLAGKNQGWLLIGASMFSSNIGSEIILVLLVLLLWWVFSPFGIG